MRWPRTQPISEGWLRWVKVSQESHQIGLLLIGKVDPEALVVKCYDIVQGRRRTIVKIASPSREACRRIREYIFPDFATLKKIITSYCGKSSRDHVPSEACSLRFTMRVVKMQSCGGGSCRGDGAVLAGFGPALGERQGAGAERSALALGGKRTAFRLNSIDRPHQHSCYGRRDLGLQCRLGACRELLG
jgi:hypothetical protein